MSYYRKLKSIKNLKYYNIFHLLLKKKRKIDKNRFHHKFLNYFINYYKIREFY